MSTRVRRTRERFGRRRWLLASVFALALLASGIFAVRTIVHAVYFRQHRDAPIERWMPIRYVAHSYDVPAEVLWVAIGESEVQFGPRAQLRPLSEVAEARGRSFEEVRALLEEAIAGYRASNRPPLPRDRAGP